MYYLRLQVLILYVAPHIFEEIQTQAVLPHVACGLIPLATTTKLFLVAISLLLFCIILKLHLVFCIFPGIFLALCLKIDMIVYHSNFSGKGLPVTLTLLSYPVTLTLLSCSVILCIPARLFFNDTNSKSFKRNKPIGRKCCQLKAL